MEISKLYEKMDLGKKSLVLWMSPGGLTCAGELLSSGDGNKMSVRNPVNYTFYIDGNGKLKWDIIPFIFPSLIKDQDENVWEVTSESTYTGNSDVIDEFKVNYFLFVEANKGPQATSGDVVEIVEG